MSSTVVSKKIHLDTKTDVLLAEKTLEIVRIIEMADLIIKSKFNNDPTHWMDAILRILVLRNPAYLWEERRTYSESQEFCQKIKDNLFSMYSEMEASKQDTGNFRSTNYSDFMLTCSSLVKLFGDFSNLLVKNDGIVIDGNDFIDDARVILKNIAKFISKHECDRVAKTSDKNVVDGNHGKSSFVPPPSTSAFTVDGRRLEHNTASRIVNNKVPNTFKDEEMEGKAKSRVYNNPVFSTLNKKLLNNRDSTSLVSTQKSSSISTTDSKPSRSLSEGDRSRSVDSLGKNVPNLSKIENIREYLQSTLGDESKMLDVRNDRVIHCSICKCDIHSLQNVSGHVNGKQHMKFSNANGKGEAMKPKCVNLSITTKKEQGKTKKSESVSSDPGREVLQVSSTAIPVKNLEL